MFMFFWLHLLFTNVLSVLFHLLQDIYHLWSVSAVLFGVLVFKLYTKVHRGMYIGDIGKF